MRLYCSGLIKKMVERYLTSSPKNNSGSCGLIKKMVERYFFSAPSGDIKSCGLIKKMVENIIEPGMGCSVDVVV